MNNKLDQHIEKYLAVIEQAHLARNCLPADLEAYFQKNSSMGLNAKALDFASVRAQLIEPVEYYLSQNSKFMRTLITLILGDIFGIKDQAVVLSVAAALELIHNSSLVIDDIEDRAEIRRDLPCAHIKYGLENSLNSGCFGYFLAIDKLVGEIKAVIDNEQELQIHRAVVGMFIKGHIGNAFDLRTHNGISNLTKYSSKEFKEAVMLKTSALMILSVDLLKIIFRLDSAVCKDLALILELFCFGFQILNDVTSLDPANAKFGDDIIEKKVSYPMILFLESEQDPDRRGRFFSIVNSLQISKDQLTEAHGLLKGYIDATLEVVREVETQMQAIILERLHGMDKASLLLELFKYIKHKMLKVKTL